MEEMDQKSDPERGVEDMINLSVLNEEVILRNIKTRYERELIYTFTGSILVSVNPYKMFNIYGLDMVKKYEGQALGNLPPHLFAIGSTSYSKMIKDVENQVIVISGESGAGKTEATKLVMQYLAAVNKNGNNLITEQILEANPLLESFGNAKTIRNDNSSRFGKYIEVFFKNGSMVGARTSEYLLEKSRMVTQATDERNYHVFYEMLAGMTEEEKKKYGLQTASKYFYLNQGGSCDISGRDDVENFHTLTGAMHVLNFEGNEKDTIYKILSAVLHMGNIYFKRVHDSDHDTVLLGNDAEIKWISHLLQLSEDWLKQALTSKVTETRGDRVVSPYNIDQALDSRDAIAKALYSRLFTWLVERINLITCRAEREKSTSLAVLDIFGFEDFHTNSFEQLNINYANETMQFFFNQHIFRLEQNEYSKENIDWSHIDFQDNQPVIDLLASKPAGILSILDDECSFPQATDTSFLEKCHFHHSQNPLYEKPRMSDPEFYVRHYAGKIKYNVQQFLDKNKDTLRSDVVELLCESKNRTIAQMFKEMRDRFITKTLSKTTGRYITVKPRTPTIGAGFTESLLSLIDSMSNTVKPRTPTIGAGFTESLLSLIDSMSNTVKPRTPTIGAGFTESLLSLIDSMSNTVKPRTPTIGAGFTESLLSLIDSMSKCNPYFVRCIKPNNHKAPMYFESTVVLDQLRYTGMLETIKIRKMGYPVRIKFPAFIERYRFLLQGQRISSQLLPNDVSATILKTQGPQYSDQYRVGSSKVFMKESFEQKLDEVCGKMKLDSVLILQKSVRTYLARKRFLRITEATRKIQVSIQRWTARKKFLALKHGVVRIQAQYRMYRQRNRYRKNLREKLERERQEKEIREQEIRKEREEKERKARAMAMIANLDIPGQLAFVYNKLDDWHCIHSDRQIVVIDGHVTPLDMKYNLPEDINSHPFSKFTNVYFKDPNWGVTFEPIRSPLTTYVTGEDNSRQCVSTFKLILRYMNDQTLSAKKEKALTDYIVQMGLQNEAIRDEIYSQIANQLWNNQKVTSIEKGWCLMAACLSAFPPSEKIFRYLLKFVSDIGYNGYKILCQHKALQCAKIEAQLCRVYPPCLLEWRAIQQHCNMSIPVNFADGKKMMGPVESWTTAELFTSHLLNTRGLKENSFGWTLQLQEDVDYYELMGYEYVLDLLSEMEIPPGFPVCKSYNLVSSDRTREPSMSTRRAYTDTPHNTDAPRYMMLSGRLPDPFKVVSKRLEERSFSPRAKESKETDGIEFSMTSVLNQRPTDIALDGLSESKLNLRYMKRKAPHPPSPSGITNGFTNGDISPIIEGKELDLSQSKLNTRYTNGVIPNGGTKQVEDALSPHSKLNARYMKSGVIKGSRKPGVQDKISKKQNFDRTLELQTTSSDISHVTGQSDWSHWVEDVFNSALDEHVDSLSDARSVENRLKGGGKGIPGPGMQQAQPPPPPTSLPLFFNGNVGVSGVPIQNSPGQNPNMAPQDMATLLQFQQQLAAQQMAQQQAQQQALLQAYVNQMGQAQAQAQMQARYQQQQQQQQQQLMQSAQQQLLQQQMVGQQNIISPGSSMNSVGISPFPPPQMNGAPSSGVPVGGISVSVVDNASGQPKKVYKIKSQFEGRTEHKSFGQQNQPTTNGDQKMSTIHTESQHSESHHDRMPIAPAPPPPVQYQDHDLISPRMQIKAPPPPPPPPPPIVYKEDTFDRQKGTFSFTDKTGRARTVRIGRVIWPPPSDDEEKAQREVGRLEIDEKVEKNLKEKYSGKKWKKPEPEQPVARKESAKKTKSLAETVHLATLQLLENKLGGNKVETHSDQVQTDDLPPTPPPPRHEVVHYASKIIETEPPPPPLPIHPPPRMSHATQELEMVEVERHVVEPVKERTIIDYHTVEKIRTPLYPQSKEKFLSYQNVPWTMNARKELFHPRERLENPTAQNLIFDQIVQDVYNPGCVRVSKDERIKMRGMLENYGINDRNYLTGPHKNQVKKIIIDTAKDWPSYFCRMFPVAGEGEHAEVKYVGVSHSGIRFLRRERSLVDDNFEVLDFYRFEDVIDVQIHNRNVVQINLKDKSVVLYTNRSKQMKELIDMYLTETDRVHKYVVATKDYITRESTLLSYRKGDVIKLLDAEIPLERGWLYGSLNGILGYFPEEYVKPLARHEVERSPSNTKAHITEHVTQRIIQRPPSRDGRDNISETSQGTVVQDGKFSMMEYSLLNFKESMEKYEVRKSTDGSLYGSVKKIESLKLQNLERDQRKRRGSGDWSWKEQAEMVKWTRPNNPNGVVHKDRNPIVIHQTSPIQISLLKLNSNELNRLAVECFLCVMMFMDDYPMKGGMDETDCALKILKHCHKFPELRDEVYCQLCKQTTSNRSMKPKSCIMGWRLFSIVACYCDCSEMLRPYLFKYLETTASDSSRTFSGAASICLQNLRKTFKYGGRKNVPLKDEISALANGRISKRFPFIYSGSEKEGMVHIKPCSVVKDIIEDVCNRLDIFDPVEMEEYTLFLRTKDEVNQVHFSRLRPTEYILDVTSEFARNKRDFSLVFQRTVWFFPFRQTDNNLYNDLMFFQCLPDYMDDLLLVLKDGKLSHQDEDDVAFLGSLLYRAFDRVGTPTTKDLTYLLPGAVRKLSNYDPQKWINRIHHHSSEVMRRNPYDCKGKFVDILARWPLFGSTFFVIRNPPTTPAIKGECLLAVNKNGIQFMKLQTHETLLQYSFSDVLSTRQYRSESNQHYLDMKLGNLMVQKIVRIETDQGSDISNLIGQYMQVIARNRKRPITDRSTLDRTSIQRYP